MTTLINPPICCWCKHLHQQPSGTPLSTIFECDAYPDGVPDEILSSKVDHRKPYDGDNDIQYVGPSQTAQRILGR